MARSVAGWSVLFAKCSQWTLGEAPTRSRSAPICSLAWRRGRGGGASSHAEDSSIESAISLGPTPSWLATLARGPEPPLPAPSPSITWWQALRIVVLLLVTIRVLARMFGGH